MNQTASVDTSEIKATCHVGDSLLRKHGFTIHGRPSSGPVTWQRGGRVVMESVAQRLVENEVLATADPQREY